MSDNLNNVIACCNDCTNPPVPIETDGTKAWCPKCNKTWPDIVAELERSRKYREHIQGGGGF